ncbi:MAG: filamentous hemagglutinin N-terminal domain-containing protein [Scytonematopsis contorta HA4267-MV1]|jgi:filamentous hemagglutinin family protein|nr:filamentous hemagglutinin N-terminal domain-containing protein [Scytonematopsis contorta HA4267-MV1]
MIKNQSLFPKLLFCSLVLISTPVRSQIIPDDTLGTEVSSPSPIVEKPGTSLYLINGGALRGNNLFHSFSEFNIRNRQAVYFANPVGVVNILTRVTGTNASNILGTLGVDGTANLFLINPNGILFGRDASLDLRGSFVGTTANGVEFGNQGNFSATDPVSPTLLTVNPSALLFNQINPTVGIVNTSVAPAGFSPTGMNVFGLRVPDGESLLLIGGNVSMNTGSVVANGGHIELGGLLEAGNISIQTNGDKLNLSFPSGIQRGDVVLTNRSTVTTFTDNKGSIAVNARNIGISGSSVIFADKVLGTIDSQAGDITLNATGEVNIIGSGSEIRNSVKADAKGSSGNITVNAGSFNLGEGAALNTSTSGQGNAGNVVLTVKDTISMTGGDIFSRVEAGGVGKGGNIEINSTNLSIKNGAQLVTSVLEASNNRSPGKGDAGNVNVNVSGLFDIAGKAETSFSALSSRVQTGTEGNGGNITVNAGSFNLGNNALITASTSGQGNGGNITVNAGSFNLEEGTVITASTSGQGNAGNVTLTVKDTISMTGGDIFSRVEAGGVGKGGNIEIIGANLSLKNGAQLATNVREASNNRSSGKGDAGNVNVNVSGLVDITGKAETTPSGIRSQLETGAEGNGGNITVNAGSFNLGEGAALNTSTSGRGNAGNVTLTANTISMIGGEIASTVEAGGVGKGGNIEIIGASLSLKNGGRLLTGVRTASNDLLAGKGDAGNINVNVFGLTDITSKAETFSSAISSQVQAGTEGNGGNITVNTGSLNLGDNAVITASTSGQGNAGTIKVNVTDVFTTNSNSSNLLTGLFVNSQSLTGTAGDIVVNSPKITLDNEAKFSAESASGDGGNINLDTNLLLMRRGGQITTNAGTRPKGGNGGNIFVNSTFIVAISEENSDISANAFRGAGGRVEINSRGVFGIEARQQQSDRTSDITASSARGPQGVTIINAPENSTLQNSLTELPTNAINTNALIANSCIARANINQKNSFTITGGGALPNRPGEMLVSHYSTDKVRGVENENPPHTWKKGDPIIEPTGIYRLADGTLVISRQCE